MQHLFLGFISDHFLVTLAGTIQVRLGANILYSCFKQPAALAAAGNSWLSQQALISILILTSTLPSDCQSRSDCCHGHTLGLLLWHPRWFASAYGKHRLCYWRTARVSCLPCIQACVTFEGEQLCRLHLLCFWKVSEYTLFSPLLCAWYLWYITLFNTYLTKLLRVIFLPFPHFCTNKVEMVTCVYRWLI